MRRWRLIFILLLFLALEIWWVQGARYGLIERRVSRAGVWPVLNGSHSLSAKGMKDEVKQAEWATSWKSGSSGALDILFKNIRIRLQIKKKYCRQQQSVLKRRRAKSIVVCNFPIFCHFLGTKFDLVFPGRISISLSTNLDPFQVLTAIVVLFLVCQVPSSSSLKTWKNSMKSYVWERIICFCCRVSVCFSK